MRYRILAASAAITVLATACATSSPSGPSAGAIGHPTDPARAILTIRYEGGFVPPEYLYSAFPIFALYGDGSLQTPGAQIEIYPGPALPPIITQRLSEDAIQSILRAALDAGLDRDGDYSDLGNMGVADASTTVFELTVEGVTHHVSAYALGMEGTQQAGQPDDVWVRRQALADFQAQLSSLEQLVPAGSLGEAHPYTGAAAQLLVRPYAPDDQLPQDPIRWPLPLRLDSGAPIAMIGQDVTCLVVAGDDWTAIHALATQANQLTPWTDDGTRFSVSFRPLLPDENGCAGVAD